MSNGNYIDDFNNEEFSLIAGNSISHDFDEEKDDIRLIVFNENGNLVIDAMGQIASYYIYDSSLYDNANYNPTTAGSVLGFYLDSSTGDIQITPNEILSGKLFDSGVYELNFHFFINFLYNLLFHYVN